MDTTTRRDGRSPANLLAQRLLEARWPESTGTLAGADPIITHAAALALAWHLLATEEPVAGRPTAYAFDPTVAGGEELDDLRDSALSYAPDSDAERQIYAETEHVRNLLLTRSDAATALGWSPLELEGDESPVIAKLRRIAGDS